MRFGRVLTGLGLSAGLLWSSSAWAAIYDIGTLGGTASGVYSLSQDGSYASGYGSDAGAIQQPVLFRVSDQTLIQLPNPGLVSAQARGVDIQAPIGVNPAQISVSGRIGNIMRYYRSPVTSPGTGTWATTPNASNADAGQFNTTRIDTSNREVHVGFLTAPGGSANRGYRVRIDTSLVVGTADYRGTNGTSTGPATANSIGGTGVPVGYDRLNPGGQRRAAVLSGAAGTVQTVIPGGNGQRSEANGASADGTVACGQDYIDIPNVINQAMVWKTGDAAMTLLGTLPDDDGIGPRVADAQSFAFACTNNKLVGGFSFNSANALTGERAVLWDPTGLWDGGSTNQPILLTTLLTNQGISWNGVWQFLTRVTSISNDGRTIAGWGVTLAGQTHGFVVTLPVPEPATLGLLALSLLGLRRRTRH